MSSSRTFCLNCFGAKGLWTDKKEKRGFLARIQIRNKKFKTKTFESIDAPFWNESFEFQLSEPSFVIKISLWKTHLFEKDYLGECQKELSYESLKYRLFEEWISIEVGKEYEKTHELKCTGKILIKVEAQRKTQEEEAEWKKFLIDEINGIFSNPLISSSQTLERDDFEEPKTNQVGNENKTEKTEVIQDQTKSEKEQIESLKLKYSVEGNTEFYQNSPYTNEQSLMPPEETKPKIQKVVVEDFNSRFQNIYSKIISNPEAVSSETVIQLLNLSQDFVHTAETYGKIIISEKFIPIEEKTIKPIAIGGLAGGEKYLVRGILFKFAVDNGLFSGNDLAAAKVAGRELNALVHILNLQLVGLSLPLMCLIDYKGFRLVAISHLPVNKTTLVYGSSDGGGTVYDEDPKLRRKMKKLGNLSNLQPHTCGEKLIYCVVDLEGHKGLDGRYYLLDFSRLFPPEQPNPKIPMSHLFNLFRPEFVKQYKKPLCSDGFSNFLEIDEKYLNEDIREATKYLYEILVPKFIKYCLNQLKINNPIRIASDMHSFGLNIRHLGFIFDSLSKTSFSKHMEPLVQECKTLFFIEMVVRSLKEILRERLRNKMEELCVPLEEPFVQLTLDFLNLIFCQSLKPESINYWINVLIPYVEKKFLVEFPKPTFSESNNLIAPYACSFRNLSLEESKNKRIWIIFKRFRKLNRMKLSSKILEKIEANPIQFFSSKTPFKRNDLKNLGTRVKHTSLIHSSEAFLMKLLAMSQSDPIERLDILEKAKGACQSALAGNPTDRFTLRNYASICHYSALTLQIKNKSGKARLFRFDQDVETARTYFLKAIEQNGGEIEWFQYGCFLVDCKSPECIFAFLQVLKINPEHYGAIEQLEIELEKIPEARDLIEKRKKLLNNKMELSSKK